MLDVIVLVRLLILVVTTTTVYPHITCMLLVMLTGFPYSDRAYALLLIDTYLMSLLWGINVDMFFVRKRQ